MRTGASHLLTSNYKGKPRPWLAHFHATIALAVPGRTIENPLGNASGEIIPEERGDNGFGYDPIFLISSTGIHDGRTGYGRKEPDQPPGKCPAECRRDDTRIAWLVIPFISS